jgi:hypothetical protein
VESLQVTGAPLTIVKNSTKFESLKTRQSDLWPRLRALITTNFRVGLPDLQSLETGKLGLFYSKRQCRKRKADKDPAADPA